MISLIIPTYNRPNYLGRSLLYYRALNFSHTIVVADSSSPPVCEKNQKMVASVNDSLSIHYKLYNPDINPYIKLAQAADKVDSDYVVLCGDDDFIIPGTIEQCVRFLQEHTDYVSAHGRVVMSTFLSPEYRRLHYGLCTYSYNQLRTEDSDSPILRFQNYFVEGGSSYYSVCRRINLRDSLRSAYDHASCYHFMELLKECLNLIQGKVKCLDNLFAVRQFTPHTESEIISWQKLLASDDFSQQFLRYCNCLAEELTRVSGISRTEAIEVVSRSFQNFMQPALNGRLNLMSRAWRIICILPAVVRFVFFKGQLLPALHSPRECIFKLYCDQDDLAIDKLLLPQSPFYSDFLPVYEAMINYPNGIIPSKAFHHLKNV